MPEYGIHLPEPYPKQDDFIRCTAPRIVNRSGRRVGKTVGAAIRSVEDFLAGKRVLYGAPTGEQVDRYWKTVTEALEEPIHAKVFRKNETEHVIELVGTEQRIRAKTCWNSATLRGDYADLLILDEFQLMNEDTWGLVGAPMMLDNGGTTIFLYTPPSLHSRSIQKADDPQHAAKMYKRAEADVSGRWKTFHFTSMDNPHLNQTALDDITKDMTAIAYRMEILAEDVSEAPGALWTRDTIETNRVLEAPPLEYIVVGLDPSATATGDEAGIIVAGKVGRHIYVLGDHSVQGSPHTWAAKAIEMFRFYKANKIVAEANQGGEMVAEVLAQVDPNIPVELVHASRGKQTRAEPVAAVYEQGRGHHVGNLSKLEDECALWLPGDASPNRMDALVWAATALIGQNWWMS